jgi:hypothetical protein
MKLANLKNQSSTVKMMDLPLIRENPSTKSIAMSVHTTDGTSYFKRLQQAAWTELFHLVLLADDTSVDVITDDRARQEEVASQMVQSSLHPFVCDARAPRPTPLAGMTTTMECRCDPPW